MRVLLVIIALAVILFTVLSDFSNTEVNFEETGKINVLFCPQDNCESNLVNFLDSAEESIHCALFEVSFPSIQNKLIEKFKEIEVQVVIDDRYLERFDENFVKADKWGLMHNKFCVVDGEKLFTGSMNPTNNGVNKNNNNLLLIESLTLANNYEAEFQELWDGEFKKGNQVKIPEFKFNNFTIKNYFCPEDYCADKVKEELKQAKESIYFMTFSFTHEGIANVLLLKNQDGINIKGIIEARQVNKYSQFSRLEYNGIDVIKDKNKQNMHHKVFIIDQETVITGSFNPTNGGNEKNDENLLIINDKEIAGLFLEEFDLVYTS